MFYRLEFTIEKKITEQLEWNIRTLEIFRVNKNNC